LKGLFAAGCADFREFKKKSAPIRDIRGKGF
jgi:hypothetical protein